jgi:hypothetical protein
MMRNGDVSAENLYCFAIKARDHSLIRVRDTVHVQTGGDVNGEDHRLE